MKLAIFDLDGVLANTADLHTQALRNAVEFVVAGEAHQEPYLDASDGIRTTDKLKLLAESYALDDMTIASIDRCKREFTLKLLSKLQLNKDIIKGIKSLKRRGYKIAVASNSRREFVDQVLKSVGVVKLIDYSISGDEVVMPKPDPEIFNRVIEYFGASPANTYIFEDSPNGLEAACRSRANVIVVNPMLLVTANQFDLCK